MYKRNVMQKTTIERNEKMVGESIEKAVFRMVHNKETMPAGTGNIYTERKHGVLAGYNIRTDRFEIAQMAMEKVTKSAVGRREASIKQREEKDNEVSGAEPIQGTE